MNNLMTNQRMTAIKVTANLFNDIIGLLRLIWPILPLFKFSLVDFSSMKQNNTLISELFKSMYARFD